MERGIKRGLTPKFTFLRCNFFYLDPILMEFFLWIDCVETLQYNVNKFPFIYYVCRISTIRCLKVQHSKILAFLFFPPILIHFFSNSSSFWIICESVQNMSCFGKDPISSHILIFLIFARYTQLYISSNLMHFYPLANQVAKGYSNATVRPSFRNILVNTLESTSFNGFWPNLVHT